MNKDKFSFENAIEEYNTYTDELSDYVNILYNRSNKEALEKFSVLRNFDFDTIRSAHIFFIGDAAEMLIPMYMSKLEDFGVISPTNKKPIFHNRFIIPIYNIDGKILNLVGYNKDANERYVYGTSKYYRRRETMYGLENLKYAYDLGYAIITEGITDAIRIRQLGYKNTFAMCGTHNSDFIMKQLNRCRYGVIKIPDRDEPGQRAVKKWKTYRSVTLNTYIKYKDVDEMCNDNEHPNNQEIVKMYIDNSVDWLKMHEHNCYNGQNEMLIMYL